MSLRVTAVCAVLVLTTVGSSRARFGSHAATCEISACVETGWLCGDSAWAGGGAVYATFRGVPYAKQPLGELRFKELQPADPWDGYYNATSEGPICPQHDALYGKLMQPSNMSEACIYANIHVPIHALPGYSGRASQDTTERPQSGLPILVFVHGGGFAYGSGDSDLHGPEFLMHNQVIVITFNYRLNVLGFLSLNTSSAPGNNGLRDVITLLRWVKRNAGSFGGDPEQITLAGQSAGAAVTHLLTLSKSAEGLFNRAMMLSGTALPSFYTVSTIYAQSVSNIFLLTLGINATDPEEVHRRLVAAPIQQIMDANRIVQDQIGITAFLPVIETPFPGVTTVLDEDPLILLANGVGKDIPLLVGYTNAECETFRPNFEKIDILSQIKQNPLIVLPINQIYNLSPKTGLEYAKKIEKRYFNGGISMNKYVKYCSDVYYEFPALEVAMQRSRLQDAAPVFLFQFSYQAEYSVLKEVKGLKFEGAGHIEDLTFIFKTNSLGLQDPYPPQTRDSMMKNMMTFIVQFFVYCDDATCSQFQRNAWPSVSNSSAVQYQNIKDPGIYSYVTLTEDQQEMVQFFESIYNLRT